MLKVSAHFPYPGSTALFDGFLWLVHRHNADGTALLLRDGPGASFTRSAPIDELTDPESIIARRPDAQLAVRFSIAVRDRHYLSLGEAISLANSLKYEHRLTVTVTPNSVRSILSDLGWVRSKHPRAGNYYYARTATTAAGEAA